MNKKKIFLEAARIIAEREETYSCNAVSKAEGFNDGDFEEFSPARHWYSRAFSPRKTGDVLRTGDIASISIWHDKQRDFRVLLLCFAAVVEVPHDDS